MDPQLKELHKSQLMGALEDRNLHQFKAIYNSLKSHFGFEYAEGLIVLAVEELKSDPSFIAWFLDHDPSITQTHVE